MQSGNYQQSDGGYQQFNTQEFRDQKEEFFGRKQQENLARPDHLPPSQGGRYAGFGNTVAPPPKSQSQEFFDSTLTSLASGWSLFSSTASKVAETAKEKAFEYGNIASQKVRDGTLLEDVGSQVTNLAAKVGDIGRKGWGSFNGNTMPSGAGYGGGYNAPDGDQFDGFNDATSNRSSGGGYQSKSSSKVSSPVGGGNDNGNGGGGGGWADWDDDKNNGNTKSYQNNQSTADEWSGFESYTTSSSTTTTTTAAKESSRRPAKKVSTASTDNDFGALDVKSMKGSKGTGGSAAAVKKPEDDAWDLLNN